MRYVIPQIALLSVALSAVAAFSCSSGDSKDETETHFLACKTDEDCRKLGTAFSCLERRCYQNADAGKGTGGESSGGATVTGGTTSTGGSGGTRTGGTGGTAGTGGTSDAGRGDSCGNLFEPCCDPFPSDGPKYCNVANYRCDGTTCIDCACLRGAYVPVCGADGKTYDIACGRACAPVEIVCENPCPCVRPTPCPADPPQQGTACSGDTSCFYERCSTYGRIRAQCSPNGWTVETGACTQLTCGFSAQCAAGQACVIKQGGAVIADCMPNSCNGLVTCDCVDGCFQGCAVDGNVGTGATVTCNTCPQGGCP